MKVILFPRVFSPQRKTQNITCIRMRNQKSPKLKKSLNFEGKKRRKKSKIEKSFNFEKMFDFLQSFEKKS